MQLRSLILLIWLLCTTCSTVDVDVDAEVEVELDEDEYDVNDYVRLLREQEEDGSAGGGNHENPTPQDQDPHAEEYGAPTEGEEPFETPSASLLKTYKKKIKHVMAEVDTDHDGHVSVEELADYVPNSRRHRNRRMMKRQEKHIEEFDGMYISPPLLQVCAHPSFGFQC